MTKPKNYKDVCPRVKPKTEKQETLIEAIYNNCIIFATGPAGTGKTHIPVALACEGIVDRKIQKIVIARPAVNAGGEKHGYLPGDLNDKMDPYLRPIYDIMDDYIQPDASGKRYANRDDIEIAPLAFMRGRTFNNSFIIVDEAQNADEEQMLMLLTRIGVDSKIIVTGDLEQNDLRNKPSGLAKALKLAGKVDGIVHVEFTAQDCVRNPIITDILDVWSSI